MEKSSLLLEESWKKILVSEFNLPYMQNLKKFLQTEIKNKKTIFPHGKEIFSALNATTFENVKVVIIGQDPYHGEGQAHGMSFSVKPQIKIPPSLQNIYKELKNDLNIEPATHGYLMAWAQQGILLLNSVLTVEKGKPASHRGQGWEIFTDKIVEELNNRKEHLVFILWGKDAQKKGSHIDRTKHLVLESAHPSPFSAHLFWGNKHFSKTNDYLQKHHKKPIKWEL